jgi:vitamin B12 transporter
MKRKKMFLAVLMIQLVFGGFLFAQDVEEKSDEEKVKAEEKVEDLGKVVVTATRYETLAKETGKSIEVVTEEDIKKSGKKSVYELLGMLPGVTITGYGNYGSSTKVYIRGSRKANALLLIDGVRLSDPTSVGKQVDLGILTSDNIERIEVIKGAMSSLYGSEATGGVINIITKKGKGKPSVTAGAEGGSLKYHKEYISSSGSTEKMNYSFNITKVSTEGESSVREITPQSYEFDKDGYENLSASGAVSINIFNNAVLDMTMRYVDSEYEYDDYVDEDDPNKKMMRTFFAGGATFKHSPLDFLMYQGGVSYASLVRNELDNNDTIDTTEESLYIYQGRNLGANFLTSISMGDVNELTFGVDYLKENGETGSNWGVNNEKDIYNAGFYAHDKVSLFDMLFLNGGIRYNKNEKFGSHTTFDGGVSLITPVIGTLFRVSAGSGLRIPSFYELYNPSIGNEDLDPEESLTYDAGIEQSIFGKMITIGITYFVQEMENEILYAPTGFYNVEGKIESNGYEVDLKLRPLDFLFAAYNYTYVEYKQEDESRVLGRPSHKHNAALNAVIMEKINVNLAYTYQTKTKGYNTATTHYNLKAYDKLDLNVRYNDITENLSAHFRVENLLDEDYELAYGYNAPGRTFFAGLDLKF